MADDFTAMSHLIVDHKPDFGPVGAARLPSAAEDSPSGLGRTLGKRVGGNPSRVRIPHPPLTRRMHTPPGLASLGVYAHGGPVVIFRDGGRRSAAAGAEDTAADLAGQRSASRPEKALEGLRAQHLSDDAAARPLVAA